MGKLIMTKQTSEPIKFYTTLDILYGAYKTGNPIVPNREYKQKIIDAFDSYSEDSDGAMIVKQSELVRYFGFAHTDFKKREICITATGIELYEAHKNDDIRGEYNLIANAIVTYTFGRGNTAVESSDADVDPPKLFVKSILALNGINNSEFKILLALTHDFSLDFNSAVSEIKNVRVGEKTITVPKEQVNKYGDTKFGAFLNEIGFCYKDSEGKYQINSTVLDDYKDMFSAMTIYNKQPEVVYTTVEEVEPGDAKTDQDDDYKKRISRTVGYDVDSEYFQKQNRRKPKQSITKSGRRTYSTNARIAKTALEIAGYKCEHIKEHQTFMNKAGKPFMEMHHLIPMAAQEDFENNLDCVENIVSLCPNCHSGIHYGNDECRESYLKCLHVKRADELKEAGIFIDFDKLFEKYYK